MQVAQNRAQQEKSALMYATGACLWASVSTPLPSVHWAFLALQIARLQCADRAPTQSANETHQSAEIPSELWNGLLLQGGLQGHRR